jgi:hypothetical protein
MVLTCSVECRPPSQALAIIVAEKGAILIHDFSKRVAPVPTIRLNRSKEATDMISIHPIVVVEEEKVVTVHEIAGGRQDAAAEEHLIPNIFGNRPRAQPSVVEGGEYSSHSMLVFLSVGDYPYLGVGMVLIEGCLHRVR